MYEVRVFKPNGELIMIIPSEELLWYEDTHTPTFAEGVTMGWIRRKIIQLYGPEYQPEEYVDERRNL